MPANSTKKNTSDLNDSHEYVANNTSGSKDPLCCISNTLSSEVSIKDGIY